MSYQRDPLRRQWGPLSSFRSLLASLLFFVSNIRWFHLQATSRLRPGSTDRPTRAHLIVMTNLQGLELLRWGLGLGLGNFKGDWLYLSPAKILPGSSFSWPGILFICSIAFSNWTCRLCFGAALAIHPLRIN